MSSEIISPKSDFEIIRQNLDTTTQVFDDYTIFGKQNFELKHHGIQNPLLGSMIFFSDPKFSASEYSYDSPFGQDFDPEKMLDIFISIDQIPKELAGRISLTVTCNRKQFIAVPHYSQSEKRDLTRLTFSSWALPRNSEIISIDSVLIPNDFETMKSIGLNFKFASE